MRSGAEHRNQMAYAPVFLLLRRPYRFARRSARISLDLLVARLPVWADARWKSKRHQLARAEAIRALSKDVRDADAWHKLGNALFGLERYKQAIRSYDKALAVAPDRAAIWESRGAALSAIKKQPSPLFTEEELALDPRGVDGWAIRAGGLYRLGRFTEAAAASDCALELDSDNPAMGRIGIQSRLIDCDWRRREDDDRLIAAGLRANLPVVNPLALRLMRDSDEEHLVAARLWGRRGPLPAAQLWRGERYRHDKIRVAYVSADFVEGPVSSLIVGSFEHHSKIASRPRRFRCGPGTEVKRAIGSKPALTAFSMRIHCPMPKSRSCCARWKSTLPSCSTDIRAIRPARSSRTARPLYK
jgi:tetratricopeptide (TPR) repeat protein